MRTGASQLPCDINFNGEVEDYDVILGIPDVLAPSGNAELTLRAYPNPATNYVNVNVAGNNGPVILKIYSSQGNVVSILEMREASAKFDMSAFPPGMYFIQAGDGSRQVTEKLLLK